MDEIRGKEQGSPKTLNELKILLNSTLTAFLEKINPHGSHPYQWLLIFKAFGLFWVSYFLKNFAKSFAK